MKREQFKEAIAELKRFEKERQLLDDVLTAISASSTGVVDFGGYFIDSYIKVLEIALNAPEGWVSAFVFECCYGEFAFTGECNGVDFSVKTEDEFYDLVVRTNPKYAVIMEECTELSDEAFLNLFGGDISRPIKKV